MKLFTVTVEFDYVVAADDYDHAKEVAREYALEAMKDISVYELDYTIDHDRVSVWWSDDCLPYGGEGNKTIGDYKNG
jgi:hypothetical protein